MSHKIIQEGDEFSCSCGLRWDVHEDDPHTSVFIGRSCCSGEDRSVVTGEDRSVVSFVGDVV